MNILAALDRLVDFLVRLTRIACIALATSIFAVVVLAVIGRYVFGQAVSWTEEVPRYLLIWISFLGAAVCVAKREHVGFDVLLNALPSRLRRFVSILLSVLMAVFGMVMLRYGVDFVRDFGPDLMETIPFTNYWYYPAMPISGGLIVIFSLKLIADELRGLGTGSMTASVE